MFVVYTLNFGAHSELVYLEIVRADLGDLDFTPGGTAEILSLISCESDITESFGFCLR